MAESPAPDDADSADSRSEDSGSAQAARPAATAELRHMVAPITGFCHDFFRSDHPQHRQRLIGTWVVAGLIVAGLGWSLYDNSSAQAEEVIWGNWIGVPTEINKEMIQSLKDGDVLTGVGDTRVDVYTDFLNKNEDAAPEVRSWARLLRAETRLRLALQRGYVSDRTAKRDKGDRRIKTGSNDDITLAEKSFERVRGDAPEGSVLRQRALYGLAIVAEVTCSGDKKSIDEAVAAYKKLEAVDGPYKELATSRRKSLQSRGAVDFYKWFVTVSESPQPFMTTPLGASGAGSGGEPLDAGLLESLTGGNDKLSGPKAQPDAKSKDTREIPESVPLPGKIRPPEKKSPEKKSPEKKSLEKKSLEKKSPEKKSLEKKKSGE